MPEEGTRRRWSLWACPKSGFPGPGSPLWFCLSDNYLPSACPWMGQSLKGVSVLVWAYNNNSNSTINSGKYLPRWRTVLKALNVSQTPSETSSVTVPILWRKKQGHEQLKGPAQVHSAASSGWDLNLDSPALASGFFPPLCHLFLHHLFLSTC